MLLAVKHFVSFFGGVILAPLVGLGTSSFGRSTSTGSHYIQRIDNIFTPPGLHLALVCAFGIVSSGIVKHCRIGK
jgi:hypothetical protein